MKPKAKKRSIVLPIILIVLVALFALAMTVYPIISNIMAERHKSLIETSYEEAVSQLDTTERDRLFAEAQAYNERRINSEYQPYSRDDVIAAREGYDDVLNVRSDGIMGYVIIPKIDVELPVMHSTNTEALDHGAGHVVGSTLPIGGLGGHSVLSAHSGMAGQKLFTDLEKMAIGDVFYIRILGETLAYQVTEINVVLPEDASLLARDANRDRCTLLTCTPYGVNTHRLLVQGDRIEYHEAKVIEEEKQQEVVQTGSTWTEMYMKGVVYGLIAVVVIIVAAVVTSYVKKRRARAVGNK